MAKRSELQDAEGVGERTVSAQEKIANLLAPSLVKDLSAQEQVGRLNAIGFTNIEISALLGIRTNHVRADLHKFKKHAKRWSSSPSDE